MMYASHDDHPLLDRLAETLVIAAWLAVPLFALLARGALAPPLNATGIAALATLALRAARATRRGSTLGQIQARLAAHLHQPVGGPAVVGIPSRPPRRHRAHRYPMLVPAPAQDVAGAARPPRPDVDRHPDHWLRTLRAQRRQAAFLGVDGRAGAADMEPRSGF